MVDVIIIAVLAVIVFFIVKSQLRKLGRGQCSGGCEGCCGSCGGGCGTPAEKAEN